MSGMVVPAVAIGSPEADLRHRRTKLTVDQVLQIRAELKAGTATVLELASRYECDTTNIRAIRDRKTWRWLPEGGI